MMEHSVRTHEQFLSVQFVDQKLLSPKDLEDVPQSVSQIYENEQP